MVVHNRQTPLILRGGTNEGTETNGNSRSAHGSGVWWTNRVMATHEAPDFPASFRNGPPRQLKTKPTEFVACL